MKRAVLLGTLLACNNNNEVVVAPVVDVPVNDSASPFPVDSITLSAAHSGNPLDFSSATFTKGETVDLVGIPFSDDLVLHMVGRVGTSDVAYGRSCTFTVDQNAPPPQPHLYFSRNAKFGARDFMTILRTGGTSVTYHDGSGILVGGVAPGSSTPVTDVERFDPNSGEYTALTSIAPRLGAVVTLLGLGNETLVTVLGGVDATGGNASFIETIEAENPADRRVGRLDLTDDSMDRTGLTATTLTSGDILVMGGSGTGSGCGSANDPSVCVEEVTLSNAAPAIQLSRATLLHGRWNHTATRLGDEVDAPVLVAGGIGAGSGSSAPAPVAQAELYKPHTGDFSTTFNAQMVTPRSQHQAVRLPDGSVVIIGGIDATGAAVRQIEVFTLDGGFTVPASSDQLPVTAGAVDFTATSLPDGSVLVTGGRPAPGAPPVSTAVIVQINSNTGGVEVLSTDHLTVARAGHSATVLCDGSVLISGGTMDPSPAELYNPPAAGRR
jgi:hypothetical protein